MRSRITKELSKPISGLNDSCSLFVEKLHVSYGQIKAIKGISMSIQSGEIVSIIGANGAGKSTLLKSISGLIKPIKGDIRFQHASIVGLAPEKITRLGLVHVPEGRQILATLTVYENLELGSVPLKNRDLVRPKLHEVFEYFPVLKDKSDRLGGTLSGGEQQVLAIGRALMAEPQLLIMDEPSLGLAPLMVDEIFRIILKLREAGKTILLVEQNARKALLASDRSYLLENGLVVMSGPSSEMINNQKIKDAYLGTG
jgi:branched-chain amino acid transport system ATP-binding protein